MKKRLLNFGLAKWALPLCTGLFMTASLNTQANNVSVSNVVLNMTSSTVGFDISWDNSWRNTSAAGQTQNFDGVWVFVKFRLCSDRPVAGFANPGYRHAWLSTIAADHVVGSGAAVQVGTSLIPISGGTPRGMGVFIYRNTDGTGTFSLTGTPGTPANLLKWDMTSQGLTGANLDILVNAVEMVYIPSGGFYCGDGASVSVSRFGNDATVNTPYLMNSENGQQMNSVGNLYSPSAPFLPGPFPKGTAAFWTMKYEVTQEQYKTYLNALSRVDQIARVPGLAGTTPTQATAITNIYGVSTTSTMTQRNGIRITGALTNNIPTSTQSIKFVNDFNTGSGEDAADDGQTLACNFLSPSDLTYYLDWAALAGMTELQFEKICRGAGKSVVVNEFPYGLGTSPTAYTAVTGSGTASELGTPAGTAVLPSVNYLNAFNAANSVTTGPMRVGQSYTALTVRESASSAYYGVADMAGNVFEYVMGIDATTFNGQPGDGDISTNISNTGWPTGWETLGANTGGARGGNYVDALTFLRTSDRGATVAFATRDRRGGGRGVRN